MQNLIFRISFFIHARSKSQFGFHVPQICDLCRTNKIYFKSNLSPHYPIVYDMVLTNKGNFYNKGDRIFIAPFSGVFGVPWASLEITRNSNALGSTFEKWTSSGSGYHCGSTLLISDVAVGNHIFIRTQETTRGPKLQWSIWKNLIFWLVIVLKNSIKS